MKVIQLNPVKTIKSTEKLIVDILRKDINAFKATSKQFIKNNQAYFSGFTGIVA